jgi:ABC-type multidrug transport system fused ATPase/permease subunit
MLIGFNRIVLLFGIINASGRVTVNCFLSVASIVGQGVAAAKHRPTDFSKQLWTAGHRNTDVHSHALQGTNEPNIRNEFIGKNKGDLFKLSIIAIIATVSAVSVPLFFSKVLEALTAAKFDLRELLKPLSMMLLCHTVEPIMTILYVQKCSLLIDRFISTLRMSVYSNILRRDVSSFELNSPISSSQLVTGEIDKIKGSAMSNISRDRGLRSILELLSGLGILYKLCVPLAMFFSTIIPITAYVSSRYANGLFSAAAKEGEASTKQASRVQETISNFKEVYSFSNQPLEERRFSEVQGLASTAAINTGYAKALFEAANRAGIYINILSLFAVGGVLVQKKIVLPTVLVSFIGYCFSLNFATQGLLFSFGDLKSAGASWEKVQKFIKESSNPTRAIIVPTEEHVNSLHSAKESGSSAEGQPMDIQLQGVSFSYKNRPEVVVLHDVNLSIPRGKVTALVGPSGAGKSTIAALLNKFYEPTSGTMTVNGVSSEDIRRDDYLRDVSVVRQSPSLFTDTVANNIGTSANAAVNSFRVICCRYRTVVEEWDGCHSSHHFTFILDWR